MNESPKLDDDLMRKAQAYNDSMKKEKRIKTIFFVVAALIILIYMMGGFEGCSSSHHSTSSSNVNATCYYYSQRLVKNKLKSPKSAEFPSYSSDFVTRSGNTVTVSAYVDADNSFGAHIRVNYIATITLENNEPVSGSATLIE